MSTYNTTLKEKSPMKASINKFLGRFSNPETKAIVIDAESLLSSSTLKDHGVNPLNIVVINTDESIIKKAHKKGHTLSIPGISSAVLPKLHGSYDIIYLDYCGFPDIRSDGFNPHYDILWSGDRLSDGGIMVVTFSRRATNCVEKAESMIPVSLELVKTICYSETCAMFAMILTKGKDHRFLRDTFNDIKLKVHQPKKRKPVDVVTAVAKKPKVDVMGVHAKGVAERMTHALPDKYSLIVYCWKGHLSPGVVEKVKNEYRMKVLWVDEHSPFDYGSTDGYYPFRRHMNLGQSNVLKKDGDWAYLYDTYEIVDENDLDELKEVPIKMKKRDYLVLKESVQQNTLKKAFLPLVEYFGVKLLN